MRLGHEQLKPYDTVTTQCLHIDELIRVKGSRATGHGTDGDALTTVTARRVLLATGVSDILPPLPGFCELWGRGVLHCPYCHSWEVRGQSSAVYTGRAAPLRAWCCW